eukprot:gene10190-11237_t
MEASKYISSNQSVDTERNVFAMKERCLTFLKTAICEVECRLPRTENVLKDLRYISPDNVLSQTARKPFKELPFAHLRCEKSNLIEDQYRKIKFVNWADEDVFDGIIPKDTVKFWLGIIKYKNSGGSIPFRFLAEYALSCLCVPCSIKAELAKRLYEHCWQQRTTNASASTTSTAEEVPNAPSNIVSLSLNDLQDIMKEARETAVSCRSQPLALSPASIQINVPTHENLVRITSLKGKSLAEVIVKHLEDLHLELDNIVAMGSNISGKDEEQETSTVIRYRGDVSINRRNDTPITISFQARNTNRDVSASQSEYLHREEMDLVSGVSSVEDLKVTLASYRSDEGFEKSLSEDLHTLTLATTIKPFNKHVFSSHGCKLPTGS